MQNFNLKEYGEHITRTVTKSTGIPVSMGVAPTKTLAKLANRFAKKYPAYNNCCVIDTEEKRFKALKLTEIKDVWGIGRRIGKRLNRAGVFTAYDFIQKPCSWIRKEFTVVGEQTWKELRGESCIDVEMITPPNKQICTSRAFGQTQTTYEGLSEAVATYAGLCAEKLRKQHSCAVSVMVFIHTNNFREDLPQYAKNCVIELPVPSSSTMEIVKYCLMALRRIFKTGYQYKKAGVIITEIVPESSVQLNMFDSVDREKHSRVMKVMDQLNNGFNRNVLNLAVQGTERKWKLKQKKLSPRYTTDINQIITVNCK